MIRSITTSLLLVLSATASADTLYRWQEADGSITFSPKPPAAGIAYEKVDKDAGRLKAIAAAADALPTVSKENPAVSGRGGKIQYAPNTTATNSTSDSQPVAAAALATTTTNISETDTQNTRASQPIVASNNKQRHCQDLQKRVISLERRMRSQLSADDMDNTVVHMARYQASFNRHCQR
ncbi:MAG: DUF4124 domain-containing protein [Granulosicoccus sp.]